MNKTLISLFVAAFFIVGGLLVFRFDTQGTPPPKPQVATTIYPLYSLATEIAGEETAVQLILEPGQSPHTFDPTPSLIKDLQGTDIMFAIGADLDTWVHSLNDNVYGSQVVSLDKFITLRPFQEEYDNDDEAHHEEEDANHEHGDMDPHFWLDPENADMMIDIMANYIAANDPAHLDAYNTRAQTLKEEIRAKQVTWDEQMAAVSEKEIVTFHDAFGYFADAFGLHIAATFEPFPGKEPTPQYLATLSEILKEHSVTTLYLEPQMATSAIETFAKDNNLTIGTLDPLGGAEGRERYIDLIQYNINAIVAAQ